MYPAFSLRYGRVDLSMLAEPLDVRIGLYGSFGWLFESDTYGGHLTCVRPASCQAMRPVDRLPARPWTCRRACLWLEHCERKRIF